MHTSSRLGTSASSILLPSIHQGYVVHHSDRTLLIYHLTDKSQCLFHAQTGKPWTLLPGQRKKKDAAPLTAIGRYCLFSSASWPAEASKPCKLQPKSSSTLKPAARSPGYSSVWKLDKNGPGFSQSYSSIVPEAVRADGFWESSNTRSMIKPGFPPETHHAESIHHYLSTEPNLPTTLNYFHHWWLALLTCGSPSNGFPTVDDGGIAHRNVLKIVTSGRFCVFIG